MKKKKETTQEQIARRANISQAMVSYILSGSRRTSYAQAKKLAQICGCRPEIFMDGETAKIRKIFKRCFNYK